MPLFLSFMDLLDTKNSLEHMYQSYGKNWPVAFYPYYKQGVDQQIWYG
ncbi:PhoPQ-regulated protein [Salmonella enterica subsp. indica]|uniref:PhoPQ-regulated protein n=1 Tax=Salmonella enterica subsp. indica TaxID=59207 RepID=A0A379YMB9_SALER|nr:PhoPQ-regulated protein [Salmonella enterica subsp. indica]